ncbi:hypothetical protein HPB48_015713 [Haemaphysalis longicornis]|uniref:Hexosyltransferase n=1 Tax=Haemaphysalis longicornis TaxID=44386 RepID=A0A9J6FA61_HAELO|nr:hypothetical protein HPB48_015713 [Haemaphysalis longicornis]
MLQWANTFCPRVNFILKADDDAYLDLPALVSFLEAKRTSRDNHTQLNGRFLLGKIIQGKVSDRERRSSNFTGASAFAPSNLPSYLSGAAYVVPRIVVRPMLDKAVDIPSLSFEDVFITGIVAAALKLKLIHSNCFDCCDELPDSCAYRGLLAATVSNPSSLRSVWKQVRGLESPHCLPGNDTTETC